MLARPLVRHAPWVRRAMEMPSQARFYRPVHPFRRLICAPLASHSVRQALFPGSTLTRHRLFTRE